MKGPKMKKLFLALPLLALLSCSANQLQTARTTVGGLATAYVGAELYYEQMCVAVPAAPASCAAFQTDLKTAKLAIVQVNTVLHSIPATPTAAQEAQVNTAVNAATVAVTAAQSHVGGK